jgi:hypothetical protein
MARRSLDLIEAMYAIAASAQPITGRGVGYKLFTAGHIASMGRAEMQRVYRLLKEAREQDQIPWEWLVDETRTIERVSTWNTQPTTHGVSRDPIAATSGISSRSAARCGAALLRDARGVASSPLGALDLIATADGGER